MKKLLTATFLMLFLFVVFGIAGGALLLFLIKEKLQADGRLSSEQISHVKAVLEMEPDHFQKHVIVPLSRERQPIGKRETDLQDERKRLAHEWRNFNQMKDLWIQHRDEERTRLRADKLALSNERKLLDGLREDIEQREKAIAQRENAIRSQSYLKWLDMLRKRKADEIGQIIVDRSAIEIVQDLSQLKANIAGEVVLYLHNFQKTIKDERERDAFKRKLEDIIELARDGGLKLATSDR